MRSPGAYYAIDIPHFEDTNTGLEGAPSPEQIKERAAFVRSLWDERRWLAERRRQGVPDDTRLRSRERDARFKCTDRDLIRRMLWTDDCEMADVIRAYHRKRKVKG